MPCAYEETAAEREASAKAMREKLYKEGWDAHAKQTQHMLCSACTALERLGYNFAENPQLDTWWDTHKKEDAKREARELAKREAAAKEKLERERAIKIAESKPVTSLSTEEKTLLKKYKLL